LSARTVSRTALALESDAYTANSCCFSPHMVQVKRGTTLAAWTWKVPQAAHLTAAKEVGMV